MLDVGNITYDDIPTMEDRTEEVRPGCGLSDELARASSLQNLVLGCLVAQRPGVPQDPLNDQGWSGAERYVVFGKRTLRSDKRNRKDHVTPWEIKGLLS